MNRITWIQPASSAAEHHLLPDPVPNGAGRPVGARREGAPVRLLLINPRFPESFWSLRWAVNDVLPGKRSVNPPLGLATLAALSPPNWDITIVDENVETIPLAPQADIIGVCGMGVQFERQKELLEHYRRAGYYVVAGGSFASLCPERYETVADAVVAGEAEYIWKRFCAEFERGEPARLYRESGTVQLEDSPTPRFDLLKLDRYTTVTLQFSRGCPYLCEFCDIIVMFGRKPRHKALPQVERELDALRAQGVRNVFFVDDNLIGNIKVARLLLRFLVDYQKRHGYPFRFGTEVSINLAQHKDLLELFRDALFTWVFVGIESSDPETLRQTRKTQNTHEDTLTSVRRLYEYGIDVLAGFIVGFDNDTVETFEHQYRFVIDSGIQVAMIGLLTALPKTPLYERLAAEGRLREMEGNDNTKPATNVVPKGMSYELLVEGYERLYRRLTSNGAIAQRVRNKLRFMPTPVYDGDYPAAVQFGIVARLLWRGVLRGGPSRLWHFLRTFPWLAPRKGYLVLVDWIVGLSMRDYVDRHFFVPAADEGRVARLFADIQQLALRSWSDVKVVLSHHAPSMPDVSIALQGGACRGFLTASARHLETLMRKTRSSLTLRIDVLLEHELDDLQQLLTRLARYGDRVFIELGDKTSSLVQIDSSVFRLRLGAT
jgi:radical SAM superfamily enzyme YgiQ (UPF0313 family)